MTNIEESVPLRNRHTKNKVKTVYTMSHTERKRRGLPFSMSELLREENPSLSPQELSDTVKADEVKVEAFVGGNSQQKTLSEEEEREKRVARDIAEIKHVGTTGVEARRFHGLLVWQGFLRAWMRVKESYSHTFEDSSFSFMVDGEQAMASIDLKRKFICISVNEPQVYRHFSGDYTMTWNFYRFRLKANGWKLDELDEKWGSE